MSRANATYICGGDYRPGTRDVCPNRLHDWPLPKGYVDADEVAHSRLRRRWRNRQCPDCGKYGWVPGVINSEMDHQVPGGSGTNDK